MDTDRTAEAGGRPRAWPRRVRYAAGLTLGAGGGVVLLPRLTGTAWAPVGAVLGSLPAAALAGLALLWLAGLAAHTIALSAALPRLGHGRALVLSLTGSAVANLLPLGGAAGVAMNYRMTRSWGFDRQAFTTYTVVTNVWDVLARLSLPGPATVWLLAAGLSAGTLLHAAAVVAAAVSAAVLLVGAALASSRTAGPVATAIDRAITAVLGRLPRRLRPGAPWAVAPLLLRLRADVTDVVRRGWPRLTVGTALYAVLAGTLLGACLTATHAGVPVAGIVAAFALERVLGLVGVTPGGSGVVEVGLTGLLLAVGGDPVGSVAGVLLYRAFSVGLEVGVGGLGVVGWLAARRLGRERVPA